MSTQGRGILETDTIAQILHWYYLGVKREQQEWLTYLNVSAVAAQGDNKIIKATAKELGAEDR